MDVTAEQRNSNGVTRRHVESSKNGSTNINIKNASRQKYYYGGPLGATIFITATPILLLVINFMCQRDNCKLHRWPQFSTNLSEYFHWVNGIQVLFIIVMLLLHSFPMGSIVDGETLSNGKRLKYRLNGASIFVLGIVVVLPIVVALQLFSLTIFYENFTSLLVFMTILSFLLSKYLYSKSFSAKDSLLNVHGTTGNAIYDFFMGREVNPFIGSLDVKTFLLRFNIGFWAVLDISIIAVQAQRKEGFATPTLLLSAFGHALLMLDYLLFEENRLTSFTVVHQGTGFLMVFSNLVLMPTLRSLNARVALETNCNIDSEAFTVFLLGFVVASHILYRFSSSDKSLFLRYPNHAEVADYEYIQAKDGKKLLVDSWWAMVRHPNYTAEILAALSWCITTGLNDLLPFTYVIILMIVLLYRIKIVEDVCQQEYGEAWNTYCQTVPYKLIKFIY